MIYLLFYLLGALSVIVYQVLGELGLFGDKPFFHLQATLRRRAKALYLKGNRLADEVDGCRGFDLSEDGQTGCNGCTSCHDSRELLERAVKIWPGVEEELMKVRT